MCLLLMPPHPRLFLLRPIKVPMKQTRQAVHAIKQSSFFDVYVHCIFIVDKLTLDKGENALGSYFKFWYLLACIV